jgi:hypothetical protein
MFPAIEWSFDLALLGQDFPTEFFSGSVEQGATTGHSFGYDSQVQILLQAMVSTAPFLQSRAQGLGPILFAADFHLLRALCLAI